MNRHIATILTIMIAVFPANIGADEDTSADSAKQRRESDATGKTEFIRLADGSEIEVASIRIRSGYVMLTLPNGGQVAYTIGDVDLKSLPTRPETKPLSNVGAPPSENGLSRFQSPETKSLIDVEAPRHKSELNKYASALKVKPPTEPMGSYQQLPTQRVSAADSTDAASDYMEDLIALEDEKHQLALQQYKDQIQQLANLKSDLARAWNRASAACQGGTFFGGGGYGIVANSWESWTLNVGYYGWVDNSTTPACRAMMADAEALANALVSGLNSMAVAARRSGILPGEARMILSSYGFRS